MVKDISYSARIIVDTDITAVSWPRQLLCVRHSFSLPAACVRTTLLWQRATTAAVNDHSDWPLLGSTTRRGWQRARPRGWPPRYSKQLQLTC